MIHSYLPKYVHLFFISFAIFSWLYEFYWTLIFIIMIYGLSLFFYRKRVILFRDNETTTSGLIFSSVNGEVISINEGINHVYVGTKCSEIKIQIGMGEEMGISAPMTSELKECFFENGKSYLRFKKFPIPLQDRHVMSGHFFLMEDIDQVKVGMHFVKSFLGFAPRIRLLPGDRAKRQVNIGYWPFGGTLLVYVPKEFEILVKEQELIVAGVTPIAARTKDNDN